MGKTSKLKQTLKKIALNGRVAEPQAATNPESTLTSAVSQLNDTTQRLQFRHKLQTLLLEKYKQKFPESTLEFTDSQGTDANQDTNNYYTEFQIGLEHRYHPEEMYFLGQRVLEAADTPNLPDSFHTQLAGFESASVRENKHISFHQFKFLGSKYNLAYASLENKNTDFYNPPQLDERPVLLLLHGIIRDWAFWKRAISLLLPDYQILIPDMNGFGDSAEMAKEHSIQNYVDYIHKLLEKLGVDTLSVVGHSMGAFTAAELYVSTDLKIKKTVLFASAPTVELNLVSSFATNFVYQLNANLTGHLSKHAPDFMAHNFAGVEKSEEAIKYSRLACQKSSARSIAEIVKNLAFDYQLENTGTSTGQNILVVGSQADKLVPIEQTRKLKAVFPEASFLELERSGHDELLERFLDEHPDRLREFLNS